jgi:peptidoglycan/LPS O-acetylase OafA/YrhL
VVYSSSHLDDETRLDIAFVPTAPYAPQKLLGLEILRFSAAVAVLFWHYQNFWSTPAGLLGFVREQQPLYHYFSAFYQFGLYGVQVFWSISGYIFFWKYRETISERRITGKAFFILRFSRLYPLHLATLLLVAALQILYMSQNGNPFVYGNDDLSHFGLQLLMASNWIPGVASSFNGPIWSISLEILVYLIFFIVLRYLSSSQLLSLGLILAAAVAYQLGNHSPIFQCIVCFYVGGVSATLAKTPVARRHRSLLRAASIAILVLVPAIGDRLHLFHLKPVVQIVVIPYIAVLLYVLAEHCKIPRVLEPSVLAVGNMTYSSYLIHFPVQLSIAIVCAAAGRAIPKESTVFFLAYLSSVIVMAALIYRYFEMPCQRLIRRRLAGILYGNPRGTTADKAVSTSASLSSSVDR